MKAAVETDRRSMKATVSGTKSSMSGIGMPAQLEAPLVKPATTGADAKAAASRTASGASTF